MASAPYDERFICRALFDEAHVAEPELEVRGSGCAALDLRVKRKDMRLVESRRDEKAPRALCRGGEGERVRLPGGTDLKIHAEVVTAASRRRPVRRVEANASLNRRVAVGDRRVHVSRRRGIGPD